MSNDPGSDAQAVIDAARIASSPYILSEDGVRAWMLPPGCSIELDDPVGAGRAAGPRRKTGTVGVYDDDSLVRYVKSHKEPGTAIYAALDPGHGASPRVEAVLNGHAANGESAGSPGYADHRAVFMPKWTAPWVSWVGVGIDHGFVPQAKFADLVEDHLEMFVAVDGSPSGAQMLQLARDLRVSSRQELRSTADGKTLEFQSTETAQSGSGATRVTVPDVFYLALRPFEAAPSFDDDSGALVEPARWQARVRLYWQKSKTGMGVDFRWRVTDAETVLRLGWREILVNIGDGTSLDILNGVAPTGVAKV